MNGRRVIVLTTLALMVASALSLVVPAAGSTLFRNGRFVFDGYTAHNKDPLNVILSGGGADPGDGGACLQPNGRTLRSPRCFRTLVEGSWTEGQMGKRVCNGSDSLTFRTPAPKTRPHEDEDISQSGVCQNQYNMRMWGDYYINGGLGHEGWTVAVIYHEKRPFLEGGHKIDRSWERAEVELINQLIDTRGHNNDTLGSRPLCTQMDWKAVADQSPAKNRGWYSNNRISRVSAHHQTGGPTGGCTRQ